MDKAIRVLQVFGSLNIGGAESRMMDVYRNINRKKYNFDFLTMQTGNQYYEDEITLYGGKIIKIPPPRETGLLKNFKNIVNTIKENGPYDAVHAHTSYYSGLVMLAARIAGVPMRITHARTTNSKHSGIGTRIMFIIGRILINIFSTDKLANCIDAAKFLYGKKLYKNNTSIIPNAIDTEKFISVNKEKVDDIIDTFNLHNKSPIIGHVGRFESIKNQTFLVNLMIEYVKTNPNSLLVLIGDGIERSKAEELVKNNNLQNHVLFLGIRNDVNVWMKVFDIIVMPSLYEGLCGVVIEAQASGLPCVLSTGIPQEVDLGLGLLKFISLDQDIEKWIEAINEQLNTPHADMQNIRNKFKSKGFSIDGEIEKICYIYNKGLLI